MKEYGEREIIDLVKVNYGYQISKVKQQAGYIDKNYAISTDEGVKFILKLSTSDPLFFLEAQNTVLSTLSSQEVKYPQVFINKSGDLVFKLDEYHVRLLSYLEGEFLADVAQKTDELYFNFGKSVANLDLQLSQIEVPSLSHRHLPWDLKNVLNQKANLKYVLQTDRKRLLHYFLKQFEEIVIPQIPNLRKSIIHNDANPMNVLISKGKVIGIIDFGDMVFSCTVFESAIAMAYIMMEQDDPLVPAKAFLKGYHEVYPLFSGELSVMYYLIAARLCTTVLMSTKSRANNPNNNYASIDEERGVRLLRKLLSINPRKATNEFRSACDILKF